MIYKGKKVDKIKEQNFKLYNMDDKTYILGQKHTLAATLVTNLSK